MKTLKTADLFHMEMSCKRPQDWAEKKDKAYLGSDLDETTIITGSKALQKGLTCFQERCSRVGVPLVSIYA